MFSKKCEYGIRAVLHVAQQSKLGNRLGVKAIASAIDSPEAFTGKILQELSRKNIIKSVKGPTGGFELTELHLKELTLMDIVKSIDGEEMFTKCGVGLHECNPNKPCPLHFKIIDIRNKQVKMLNETLIFDLANDVTLGDSFLK